MDARQDAHTRATSQPLAVDALRVALADAHLGTPLVYLPAVGSTNSYAAELARGGAAEGTLVTTDDQTAGRGRIGRTWLALPGQQLALSLVLRPVFAPHFLVMASALAVANAVTDATGLHPQIKWPNDVLLDGHKVCGILIETGEGFAILGIGLNVNGSLASSPELAARATTLAQALGHPVAREPLAAGVIRLLDAHYTDLQRGGEPARRRVRDAWRERLATLGQRVTIRQGDGLVEGRAEDVDADGTLLVRDDTGMLRAITWGDVE